MLNFIKPTLLNSAQLLSELVDAGVDILDVKNFAEVNGEGELYLAISETDKTKAAKIVANHIGIDTSLEYLATKASALAKLAALGLTEDEVKSIVG